MRVENWIVLAVISFVALQLVSFCVCKMAGIYSESVATAFGAHILALLLTSVIPLIISIISCDVWRKKQC